VCSSDLVIEAQRAFNSDIAMVLDVCSPPDSSREDLVKARSITKDWALRSKSAWSSTQQHENLLFGIIQGGTDMEIRTACLEDITEIGFDGYALGGLSVGEPHEVMLEVVKSTASLLPEDKPRYLMGLGNPSSLIKAVALGIDMFDSVLPTRIARNGTVYVADGRLNLKNACFADDLSPIDNDCGCHACQNYSRAYLRHLFINGEILCHRLLTLHNLHFMESLFSTIRGKIVEGTFESFKEDFLSKFKEEVG
jgi:queuine tRNA-ribosyltransferase